MSRRIRVLHIADKFGKDGASVHGVTRLFSWWFPRFDATRFTARLVGLRNADAATENLVRQGIEVQSLGKGKFDPSTLTALMGVIRSERPHVLHLHGYGACNFGRLAARLAGLPAIVHEHFVDPAIPGYQRGVDSALAPWTDIGIAVSASVKQFMVKQRGLAESRVRVVYNGAPLAEFSPMEPAAASAERRRWNIPADSPLLLSVGRLDEQKGYRYFLDAVAQLRTAGRRVVAMLVGDGPQLEQLRAQCRTLGITDDVMFAGFQSDVRRLQAMADIQVFPSLWEGTPLTLFEAMAMRLPIVATWVDGLGEVLRDGETGRLVPPRDATALATAIAGLLDHPAQAKGLAMRAKEESRRYDIQQTVERLQSVYVELACAHGNGSPKGPV
jgi:glycosyltransferase involved in cell wall biosynthesis